MAWSTCFLWLKIQLSSPVGRGMKRDMVFKRAFDEALRVVGGLGLGVRLPSEYAMAPGLGSVGPPCGRCSRAFTRGDHRGRRTAAGAAASPEVRRYPKPRPRRRRRRSSSASWSGCCATTPAPGPINELDLARQFGVATTRIREFLNRFQRFGLIEKRPNGGWVLRGLPRTSRSSSSRSAKCSSPLGQVFGPASGKVAALGSARSLRPEHQELLRRSKAVFTTSPTWTAGSIV